LLPKLRGSATIEGRIDMGEVIVNIRTFMDGRSWIKTARASAGLPPDRVLPPML